MAEPLVIGAARDAFPLVKVDSGVVRGRWRDIPGSRDATWRRSAAFLGIPFAEAPVGVHRFAAPMPVRSWRGVLDADSFGATAQRGDPGVTLIPEPSIPGDATLNVNVFTPSPTPAESAALPVLVWFHGGGFVAGSPASEWYDGSAFNRDGIVTVTLSYRLGFDGFGWMRDAPANRGVRDWVLALDWVRRNIRAFGGDPNRVTIAGQSAGGSAVLTVLGMESAQHLFHGAWVMSPALTEISPSRAEIFGNELAARARVRPMRSEWQGVTEDRLRGLQKAATRPTLRTFRALAAEGLPLGPVVDGEMIRRSTRASLRRGVGADKPVVIGATDDEFTMATRAVTPVKRLIPASAAMVALGVPRARRSAYLAANRETARRGAARFSGRLLTDVLIRTTVLRILADRRGADTWAYRFAWPSGRFGFAEHCLDVPFFFDHLDAPGIERVAGSEPPQSLADEVHAAAVDFIHTGRPGWPPAEGERAVVRVFDVPARDERDGYASVRPLVDESGCVTAEVD